jgi:hypothetical protein
LPSAAFVTAFGPISAPEFTPGFDDALGQQSRHLVRIVIGVQPLQKPAHMQAHFSPRRAGRNAEIAMKPRFGEEQHFLEIEDSCVSDQAYGLLRCCKRRC